MTQGLAYCGAPPVPGELLGRFNADPFLILVLALLASAHVLSTSERAGRSAVAAGWLIAATALISPLCALSVALFSARVGQHMILLLVAAPLVAIGAPGWMRGAKLLWPATVGFFVLLWFWHMPLAYDATFASAAIYWAMHITLFGAAVLLWSGLLHCRPDETGSAICAGTLTSVQMSLLGAVLSLSSYAWFPAHYQTVQAWGFTPLSDQQLGGVLMWVPGCALFLVVAMRSLRLCWRALEPAKAV
jgi:putative membrane protein